MSIRDEINSRLQIKGEIGEGWWPIVEELHRKLEDLQPGYELGQIKEKFGGLRYYCSGGEEAGRLVAEAEQRCWKTCEDCGATENVTTGPTRCSGWVRTLCGECR